MVLYSQQALLALLLATQANAQTATNACKDPLAALVSGKCPAGYTSKYVAPKASTTAAPASTTTAAAAATKAPTAAPTTTAAKTAAPTAAPTTTTAAPVAATTTTAAAAATTTTAKSRARQLAAHEAKATAACPCVKDAAKTAAPTGKVTKAPVTKAPVTKAPVDPPVTKDPQEPVDPVDPEDPVDPVDPDLDILLLDDPCAVKEAVEEAMGTPLNATAMDAAGADGMEDLAAAVEAAGGEEAIAAQLGEAMAQMGEAMGAAMGNMTGNATTPADIAAAMEEAAPACVEGQTFDVSSSASMPYEVDLTGATDGQKTALAEALAFGLHHAMCSGPAEGLWSTLSKCFAGEGKGRNTFEMAMGIDTQLVADVGTGYYSMADEKAAERRLENHGNSTTTTLQNTADFTMKLVNQKAAEKVQQKAATITAADATQAIKKAVTQGLEAKKEDLGEDLFKAATEATAKLNVTFSVAEVQENTPAAASTSSAASQGVVAAVLLVVCASLF